MPDDVVLSTLDRAEFIGALDACSETVSTRSHRDHADSVLTASGGATGDREDTPHGYPHSPRSISLGTRTHQLPFRIVFKSRTSRIYSLLIRESSLLATFSIYKFRTIDQNNRRRNRWKIATEDRVESIHPYPRSCECCDRRIGEIPQLWSILRGDMSVVGPRPERPVLDSDIQTGVVDWQKRWFVKPGLTGPAQVNHVTGKEPGEKLRYDIEYVRDQSFSYNMKLVFGRVAPRVPVHNACQDTIEDVNHRPQSSVGMRPCISVSASVWELLSLGTGIITREHCCHRVWRERRHSGSSQSTENRNPVRGEAQSISTYA
ncbi:hypothetical protein C8039_16810 [Halogeometricum sp. wsp3]|nr:hypothetical protein C8039_16810 [Halogeometricum sp. wsp3]